jgi:hypothetical protein
MTDYSRINTSVLYAENSDYTGAGEDFNFTYEATPTKRNRLTISAATGGTSYTISYFTTITGCVFKNNDSTNFVTITYRNAGNGANDNKVKILAGQHAVLTDLTVATALTLTADTAAVEVEIYLEGT